MKFIRTICKLPVFYNKTTYMYKLILLSLLLPVIGFAQNKKIEKKILQTPGIVAFWDFNPNKKDSKQSRGKVVIKMIEGTTKKVSIINEGPLSGYSAYFEGDNFLYIPYKETGALNIQCNTVTVIAWIKWMDLKNCFIAGMWNEGSDGGKRQYGLFVSLPYYNGLNQVCGHISKTGKPTRPFPFSIDYSASKQCVQKNKWCCVAFTYDGNHIKSYLNGVFAFRKPELINNTKGFPGFPNGLVKSKNPYYFPYGIGNNGSDFTFGAVMLKKGMGNFFKGLIGGIAIYNRALTDDELLKIGSL